MEEDEELLLLRIKALKSSSRVNIQVDIHSDSDGEQKINQVKQGDVTIKPCYQNKTVIINASVASNPVHVSETTNNEVALRQMALNSISGKKSNSIKNNGVGEEASNTSSTSNLAVNNLDDNAISNGTKNPTVEGKNIEELSLREKALKTLLQKRVAKTEKLIKHVVQHEKVSSTSNVKIKEGDLKNYENTDSSGNIEDNTTSVAVCSKKKKQICKSIPTPVLRNFLPSDQFSFKNLDNEEQRAEQQHMPTDDQQRLDSVHIGSDDELSLCASDRDEGDLNDNTFDDIQTNQNDSIHLESDSTSLSDIQCNIVSSCCFEKETSVRSLENPETQIIDNVKDTSERCIPNIDTKLTDKIPEVAEITINKAAVDESAECLPGPSGYKNSIDYISDSDSDGSVVEVTPPIQCQPRVVSLLSNSSGSDEEGIVLRWKGKFKKHKKTVKEYLMKQDGMNDSREDLKDLSCSVCLGPFENRSFLKECFHSFCHLCIIQWSELSRACPLCKKYYTALIHTVTKDLDYKEFVFPTDKSKPKQPRRTNTNNWQFSDTMEDGRRFRYQSTIVDHERWQARRDERERIEQQTSHSRSQQKLNRRLKWSVTKDRRKAVYRMNMFVKQVKQYGKPLSRDISPKFFTDNPAIKHRLVPWLLRDLSVLLGEDDESIRFVMTLILNLISKTPMDADEFKEQLRGFLFDKTEHFVSELISFASSPYDIRGYDANVVYDVYPTVICVDKGTEERFENRLLHEVFLGDESEEPTINHISDDEVNTIDEESADYGNNNNNVRKELQNTNEQNNIEEDTDTSILPTTKKTPLKETQKLKAESTAATIATSFATIPTTPTMSSSTELTVMLPTSLTIRSSATAVLSTTCDDETNFEQTSASKYKHNSSISPLRKHKHEKHKKKKSKKKKKKKTYETDSEADGQYGDSCGDLDRATANDEDVPVKSPQPIDDNEGAFTTEVSNEVNSHVNEESDQGVGRDVDEILENHSSKKKRKKKHRHRKHKRQHREKIDCGTSSEGKNNDDDENNGGDCGEKDNGDVDVIENKTVYRDLKHTDETKYQRSKHTYKTAHSLVSPDIQIINHIKDTEHSDNDEPAVDEADSSVSSYSPYNWNSPQVHDTKVKRKHKEHDHKKAKKKHHKKHKKQHNKHDENNENYVSERLHSLLGVSRGNVNKNSHDNDIRQLNQTLKDYVRKSCINNVRTSKNLSVDGDSLKNQAEIIFELLAVEKAILCQHKKKELNHLKRKGAEMEEFRLKRKKAGSQNYTEFDHKIDDVEKKIKKCKKSIYNLSKRK